MKALSGNLRKMKAQLSSKNEVSYSMVLGQDILPLDPLLGKKITLTYTGAINCINCERKTNKSFSQGYCYPCFKSLAQCDLCIMSPEKCHFKEGTCRDPVWAEDFCMKDHYVYLANSSILKVGITRGTQIPTRWIDQGAVQALPIFRVTQRFYAGLVEVVLKKHFSDKTNWRKMLKGDPEKIDLKKIFKSVYPLIHGDISELQSRYGVQSIQLCETDTVEIKFPVLEYPDKISSLSFDKTPLIQGEIRGIKGQYLLLDIGVLNLRKFSGYKLECSI
jgi:hypothetical protein